MKWTLRRIRLRRKRRTTVTAHYMQHKEEARAVILRKVAQWNADCKLTFNRVAIRNSKRSWGSCTSLKNLNFSYKILFLPEHLQDYIIVHELCHLQHLNHKQEFWDLVDTYIPQYQACITELKQIEKKPLGQKVVL